MQIMRSHMLFIDTTMLALLKAPNFSPEFLKHTTLRARITSNSRSDSQLISLSFRISLTLCISWYRRNISTATRIIANIGIP